MPLDKLDRQLQLMLLLTANTELTVEELGERLGMSRRTIYRYLEAFRNFGFIVEQRGGIWRLDKSSPYFRQITDRIQLTEEEALILRKTLEAVPRRSVQVAGLLRKLSRIYDYEVVEGLDGDERFARNREALYTAVKEGRQALLHGYSSPNSGQTSDRKVEPFAFLDGNREIRCFELASGQNKTFKLSRIREVEVLSEEWQYRSLHRRIYTDLFLFSGEELIPVTLRLDRLSRHLLEEEYAVPAGSLEQEDEEHWLFRTQVCSCKGVGRFVMGLLPHVTVVEGQELQAYIHSVLTNFKDSETSCVID